MGQMALKDCLAVLSGERPEYVADPRCTVPASTKFMAKRKVDAWFLGLDLGTGSCKTVVVDEQGRVLGFGSSEYANDNTLEKWQEQDPNAVLNGLVEAARSAIENAGELTGSCAGVSIGGALHSLMAVDAHGKPLTGLMTWADARAIPQAKALSQTVDASRLYQETGCPMHGMYPLYKIRWLKDERPEIFQKAARFISAKEFVFSRLTDQYVVDYSVAAGSGLLNIHHLDWNPQSLDLAGIKPVQLSMLADPKKIIDGIQPELARRMGLSPKTRLVLGSSDAANSTLGAGSVSMHQATCMVGTSAALRAHHLRPWH
jgi:gluconokinase